MDYKSAPCNNCEDYSNWVSDEWMRPKVTNIVNQINKIAKETGVSPMLIVEQMENEAKGESGSTFEMPEDAGIEW